MMEETAGRPVVDCGDIDFGDADDNVWNGWDAYLIESNQGKAKKGLPHLGKRKFRATGSSLSGDKALRLGLWSTAIGKSKCREEVKQIAKTVASLALQGMVYFPWNIFKKLFPPKLYKSVRRSVFSSTAKFILSIFDLEDFEKIYKGGLLHKNYSKFYSYLKQEESDSGGPLMAIADEKVDVRKFPILREHDVGEILHIYWYHGHHPTYTPLGMPWSIGICPIDWDNIRWSYIKLAFEEMKNFVPLKKYRKLQLTLELLREKSYFVVDTLFLEAWKRFNFLEIADYIRMLDDKKLKTVVEDLFVEDKKPSEIADSVVTTFLHSMRAGLFQLVSLKQSAVLEVVQMAYIERRMRGHRFINVNHFLFALSLSRVGDSVQRILSDRGLNYSPGKHLEVPLYQIYKLSLEAARENGEEVVRLEHLVLAVISWEPRKNPSCKITAMDTGTSQANDRRCVTEFLGDLREAKAECGVKSWKAEGLECLPQGCADGKRGRVTCGDIDLFVNVIRAFESGLRLPAIRSA